jgi:hypothetical protein
LNTSAAASEKVAADVFKESLQRLDVAKECKDNVGCYAKALDDKTLVKQEKAAFMLARMGGKDGLAALSSHVNTKEPLIRMAVLFALGKQGDKSCEGCKKALDAQIEIDKTKPPMRPIVEEMRAVLAEISNK